MPGGFVSYWWYNRNTVDKLYTQSDFTVCASSLWKMTNQKKRKKNKSSHNNKMYNVFNLSFFSFYIYFSYSLMLLFRWNLIQYSMAI